MNRRLRFEGWVHRRDGSRINQLLSMEAVPMNGGWQFKTAEDIRRGKHGVWIPTFRLLVLRYRLLRKAYNLGKSAATLVNRDWGPR